MTSNITRWQLEREFLIRLLDLTHHEDMHSLVEEALQIIVIMSGARHGYIELAGPTGGSASFAASTDELAAPAVRRLLSSTIISATLAEGQTVVTHGAFDDPRFADAPSVRSRQIDAVICVPVGGRSKAGIVYLQGIAGGPGSAPEVVRSCELLARHLGTVAPALLRRVAAAGDDPTARWRERLAGTEGLVGSSEALAAVLKEVAGVATRDIGVLITGQSGSGKTAIAEIIARNGPRANEPFIALNCANLPNELVESELFGALAGSHSTATRRMIGKVAAAHKGTLFLDEVSELSPPAQAKLLQFLQDGTFFPLGSASAQRADVRVIAATNANLGACIRQGTFREDLFYRLCVIEIETPPLEARRLDIGTLAQAFLHDAISHHALPPMRLSMDSLSALEQADWPGNVRQLKNTVDAAAIRALADEVSLIEVEHLFPGTRSTTARTNFHEMMRSHQRHVLGEALARHGWNVSETATAIGLGRSSLYQLIKGLGLKKS